MLLVASETGHVYTFATEKLKPIITSEAGKTLIQSCLNNGNINSNGSSNGLNGSSLSNEKISIENFDEFDDEDEDDDEEEEEEEDDFYYEEEDDDDDDEGNNYDMNNINDQQDNDNVNSLSVLQHHQQSADSSSLIIENENNNYVDRLNKFYASNIYNQNGGGVSIHQINTTSNSNNNNLIKNGLVLTNDNVNESNLNKVSELILHFIDEFQ